MDENKNPIKKRLSEQLPLHTPDPGTWQRLSAKLDALSAETAYQEKLQQLPVHSPDQGTWKIIYARLNRIAFYKTGIRIALSAAAGLLLFFSVSQIVDSYQTKPAVPKLARQEQPNNMPAVANPAVTVSTQTNEPLIINKAASVEPAFTGNMANTAKKKESLPVIIAAETTSIDNKIALNTGIQVFAEIEPKLIVQNTSIHDAVLQLKEILKAESEPQISVIQNEQLNSAIPPPLKYYTPDEPAKGGKNNHFALAMNYLPENINNGTNNSMFHNVDITASYNKEKVRFNTSLGMAYNEEQLEFEMNYDIKTPVTAIGSGGQVDTLGYNVSKMETDYLGTEKHQYFTYNLGIGRRLFSFGKFSSWINAGAGFGLRLNNPDLITSTENAIKGRYNAMITSDNSSKPVYNNVNINFVTGVDFNYKIFKRVSITFTPTSRWYFKPVLTKDNQATDELTLGFKTGMKFDF